MKILVIGYHNPHFINTLVYREKAIKDLGHQVIALDDRNFLIPGRFRDSCKLLHSWDLDRLNRNLVAIASKQKPDLCIVVGGDTILPTTVTGITNLGIPCVLWTTNVPIDFDNIIESAPLYDYLFCAGSEALTIFQREGLTEAAWIPYGCDPDYHAPMQLDHADRTEYGSSVAFVGSYYPNRARLLEALSDLDIHVWGPYWDRIDKSSPLMPKITSAKVNYTDWVKIYNASEITVVVHYHDEKIPSDQASPKLFEALACACFVLVDDQKDVRALFEDNKHLVFFNSPDDLRQKVSYYLQHPEERDRIRKNGYMETISKHTFRHRIETILTILTRNGICNS
jgi:spore maturation protein CgeB